MWVPHSAAELLQALDDGTLPHESAAYEYKAQLPDRSKNSDIALDVAALTRTGGVIIFGVAEDKEKVTFSATPIELAGAQDRISNVVTATVRERPDFKIHLLPSDDDPSVGFVVVEVPASIRAPHMVEVKGEYRYYGRVPGGNVRLTETEVAQLYERRRVVEADAYKALNDAIAKAPIEPASPKTRADFHLVIRPILADPGLRLRAGVDDEGQELQRAIRDVHGAMRFAEPAQPDVLDILTYAVSTVTFRGVAVTSTPTSQGEVLADYYTRLEVHEDGTTTCFRAAMGRLWPQPGAEDAFILFDSAILQQSAHLVRMVGTWLDRGSYTGAVDIFAAIVGVGGAISSSWFLGSAASTSYLVRRRSAFPEDEFRGHIRTDVNGMIETPTEIAAKLFERLTRIIRTGPFRDPLQLQ